MINVVRKVKFSENTAIFVFAFQKIENGLFFSVIALTKKENDNNKTNLSTRI